MSYLDKKMIEDPLFFAIVMKKLYLHHKDMTEEQINSEDYDQTLKKIQNDVFENDYEKVMKKGKFDNGKSYEQMTYGDLEESIVEVVEN